MYRKLTLFVMLLASAAWLQAQAGYPSSAPSQNRGAMTRHTTVQGCLQSMNGSYALTADNGTVYQLTGDTAMLKEHIGHEMRITGTIPETSSAGTPSATTPGASEARILQVKSFKHISTTCKSMGGTMGK